MKLSTLFLFCMFSVIVDCTTNTNNMVFHEPEGTTYYSKYYDFDDWLVDEKLALVVRAEHSKDVDITLLMAYSKQRRKD